MSARTPAAKGPRRRLVRWGVLLALVLLGVIGGLLVRDVLAARDSLRSVMHELPAAEEALLAGDIERFDDLLEGLRSETSIARTSTDGPLWWLASKVPVIGDNAAALTLVSEVVDDVAADVLPHLGEASGVLTHGAVQISDSRVDLDPIRQANAPLIAAYGPVVEAHERMQAFDTSGLVDEVAGPFEQAVTRLSDLRSVVTTGRDLTTLLPSMLGGDGPRNYLVLAQANAELRATGGIAGATLYLSADDGLITLERTATASDIGPFSEPVLELHPEDLDLYGDGLGRFIQDVTMTPQFPVGAEIAAEMWRQSHGDSIDGVIAIDPVALSFLLDEIGPVDVWGHPLDSGNVADFLLSDVYLNYPDPDDADELFAAVASTVMASVLDGRTDLSGLLNATARAAAEHRVLLWSAHDSDEAILSGGAAGGDFSGSPEAAGIFLNDGTRGKLGYYVDVDISHVSSSCTAAGRVDTMELRFSSTLTADMALSLPSYVTGVDLAAEPLGTVRTNIGFYSAVGGQIINIQRDGTVIGGEHHEASGRSVTTITQDLAPGESVTFVLDFLAAPGDVTGVTDLWTTPTSQTPGAFGYGPTYCH